MKYPWVELPNVPDSQKVAMIELESGKRMIAHYNIKGKWEGHFWMFKRVAQKKVKRWIYLSDLQKFIKSADPQVVEIKFSATGLISVGTVR